MVMTTAASIEGARDICGLTAWPQVGESIASAGSFSIKVSWEADLALEPEPSTSDQDSVRAHSPRPKGP